MLIARIAVLCAGVILALPAAAPQALARQPEIYASIVQGVGVGGHDVVAYFTEGRPVKGSAEFTAQHAGAQWRFTSAKNRDLFKADPTRYAPQFGGYCSYAAARGYTAHGDPQAWRIIDGKLYLNYDKSVQKIWERNTPVEISNARANWPKILDK